jgi:hypothetical protein
MKCMDIEIGPNSTLDLSEVEGDPSSITSWSYEYIEGSADSPYIITSSYFE